MAVDAPAASYLLNLGPASESGVDVEQVQGVLAGVASIVGTARVVSASAKIVEALGVGSDLAQAAAQAS